jgi:hypothetical protein
VPDHRPRFQRAHRLGGVRTVRFFALLILAAMAACAPQGTSGCDVAVTRELSFLSAATDETITARASGPACDKAVGLYAIHDAEGRPIWAWATPLPRAFGDVFEAADDDAMRDFLARWAQPTVSTTYAAPAWDRLSPGQTTLDRLTYDDIRARDLPMLCHASGTARELCVFWEPVAGGAGLFFERVLEETNE